MITQQASSTRDIKAWQSVLDLATREVFEMMVGVGLEPFEGQLEGGDVTAMVGLAGHICGVLSIRCKSSGASALAAKMLGLSEQEAAVSGHDAIAEICNMIGGNFKSKLTTIGSHCMLSIPTVITGADYQLHSLEVSEALQAAFTFSGHPIAISLELHG